MDDKQPVPFGVKIIAILYYIGAVLGVIFGLIFLVVGTGIMGSKLIPLLGALGAGLFIAAGIVILGLGVFDFFIGRGLWKAKSWARIVVIVFAALAILGTITSMMVQGKIVGSGVFNLITQLVICGYLLFSKSVKQAFA